MLTDNGEADHAGSLGTSSIIAAQKLTNADTAGDRYSQRDLQREQTAPDELWRINQNNNKNKNGRILQQAKIAHHRRVDLRIGH